MHVLLQGIKGQSHMTALIYIDACECSRWSLIHWLRPLNQPANQLPHQLVSDLSLGCTKFVTNIYQNLSPPTFTIFFHQHLPHFFHQHLPNLSPTSTKFDTNIFPSCHQVLPNLLRTSTTFVTIFFQICQQLLPNVLPTSTKFVTNFHQICHQLLPELTQDQFLIFMLYTLPSARVNIAQTRNTAVTTRRSVGQ